MEKTTNSLCAIAWACLAGLCGVASYGYGKAVFAKPAANQS